MAKRVDANQPAIVAGLRAVGASVQCIHTIGKGCPDILVGFRGGNFPIEIKTPETAHELTDDERKWHDRWQGSAYVVTTLEEALRTIGAID